MSQTLTHFLAASLSDSGGIPGLLQILSAFGVAYIGGVLASLTPCVYPMIPITISVIGGMSPASKKPWRSILLRSAAYTLGMTLIYSFLGVAAGLTGQLFGSFTNNGAWYIFLGIVMVFSALLILDVITFDPATWWATFKRRVLKLRKNVNSNTVARSVPSTPSQMTFFGAFALGASSGTIAAPCTTPILAVILAYIAKTQSIGLGLSLMVCFSLGLSTLLLLIAAFAGALRVLPKSGRWMKTVKTASGLILLVFSVYLFYRAGTFGGFSIP